MYSKKIKLKKKKIKKIENANKKIKNVYNSYMLMFLTHF